MIERIPISTLQSGDVIGVNVRHAPPELIDALAASIEHLGLLQNLGVVYRDHTPYVVYGNRRLKALQKLAETLAEWADETVECQILDLDDAGLTMASLAENDARVGLSPVDEFRAYHQMSTRGASIIEIAEVFSIETEQVEKRLALGSLHPDILAALEERKISLDIAKVFTRLPTMAEQKQVYDAIVANDPSPSVWSVRFAISGDNNTERLLEFVGIKDYTDAGGRTAHDLFDERVVCLDPPIVLAVAKTKMVGIVADVMAEGFAWCKTWLDEGEELHRYHRVNSDLEDLPYTDEERDQLAAFQAPGVYGKYTEIEAIHEAARLRSLTPEIIATTGAFVWVDYNGEVQIRRGIIPKADAAKNKAKSDASPVDAGPKETRGAVDQLRVQQTNALGALVLRSPDAAMDLFIATQIANTWSGAPLKYRRDTTHIHNAMWSVWGEFGGDVDLADFSAVLRVVTCLQPSDRQRLFAAIIAESLDVTSPARVGAERLYPATIAATVSLFDPADVKAAYLDQFLPNAYFRSCTAAVALDAIEEIAGLEEADRWRKSKRAEIVEHAIILAQRSQWLPSEIRPAGYAITPLKTINEPAADSAPVAKPLPKAKGSKKSKAA